MHSLLVMPKSRFRFMNPTSLLCLIIFFAGCSGGRAGTSNDSSVLPDSLMIDGAAADSDSGLFDGSLPADAGPDPCDGISHCSDGLQNCGEQGVDCGGDCLSCVLAVYPENPRYFVHNGKVVPLISAATTAGDFPNASTLAAWAAAGINQIRTGVSVDIDHMPTLAYNYVNATTTHKDNNWGGFDQGRFDAIAAQVANARDNDMVVFFVLFGTPMLECHPSDDNCDSIRWARHLWNAANGGPITTSPGKASFYDFAKYGRYLFGKVYNPDWGWRKKSQYRQEELLAKVIETLPRAEYPNWGLVLMWEITDGWSPAAADWAEHMVGYARSLDPELVVGIGSHIASQVRTVGADFALAEGHSYLDLDPEVPDDLPLIYEGYNPRSDCYIPGDNIALCICFDGTVDPDLCGSRTDEMCNIYQSGLNIRQSLLDGLNTSLPFRNYWLNAGSVKTNCQNLNMWDYDISIVRENLLDYTSQVRAALNTVQDWSDEPGDELVGSLIPQP